MMKNKIQGWTKWIFLLFLMLEGNNLVYANNKDTTGVEFFELAESNHNDFDKYVNYAKKALPLLKREKAFKKYVLSITGLMFVNYYKAKMENAFYYASLLEKEIEKNLVSASESYESYNRLGTFYFNNGLYSKAEQLYEKSYFLWNEQNLKNSEKLSLGDYYNNSGLLYGKKGDVYQAINYYQKALKEYNKFPNSFYIQSAIVLHNIAVFYQSTKDQHLAISYFNQAIKQHLSYPIESINKRFYAGTLLSKGFLLKEMGAYSQATQLFSQVLKLPKLRDDFYAKANRHLGSTFVKLKQFNQGKELLNLAINQHEKFFPRKHLETALTYKDLALYYQDIDNYEQALISTQKAIYSLVNSFQDSINYHLNPSLIEEAISPIDLIKILRLKAQLLVGYGKPKLALNTYKYLIQVILTIKPTYHSVESKLFLSNNTSSILEEAIHLTFDLYKKDSSRYYVETAFYFFEVNQSSLLLESDRQAKAAIISQLPDSIIFAQEKLITQINFHKKQLLEKIKEPLKKASIAEKLFEKENELNQLNKHIQKQYPSFYSTSKNLIISTLSDLQRKFLTSQQLLSTYYYGDSTIFMLAITKDKCFFYNLPKDKIEQQLIAFNNQTSEQSTEFTPIKYQQLPFQIYNTLLEKPLKKYLKIKELILIPDKFLFQLPFEALWTRKRENAQESPAYLMNNYAVTYTPNASILLLQEQRNNASTSPSFVGFAPKFKGARYLSANRTCEIDSLSNLGFNELEVDKIAKLLNGITFMEGAASKANFIQSTENSEILHLATHACIDDVNFDESRIFFTDGYLYVHELYFLKNKAKMAVLSACQTGIGQYQKGEGMLSLAHAFAYAGVPSVTMSLWSVNDQSTAQLMQYYYQQLKNGLPKHQALRQAKLDYLANCESVEKLHPYYWAGFVHLGDFQPIFVAKKTPTKKYLLFTVLFLSLAYFFYSQKK